MKTPWSSLTGLQQRRLIALATSFMPQLDQHGFITKADATSLALELFTLSFCIIRENNAPDGI